MNISQMAHLMRLLGQRTTVRAIHDATGVSKETIRKALRALEDEKVARITDWNRNTGGASEPVWTLGSEPSVPLRGMSDAEKQRLFRLRKRRGVDVMASMAQAIVGVTAARAQPPAEDDKRGRSA